MVSEAAPRVEGSWSGAMRAALFISCLDDTLFPEVGIATVRILERSPG